jgi:protein-tyrosine-phosphatase
MAEKKRSFILCAGKSARGRMAEDILRHYRGGSFEIFNC